MHLTQPTTTSNIQQIISIVHTLSNEQQKSALEYLHFLTWQNKQNNTQPKTTNQKSQFDDVFGILTAKQGLSIEAMNEAIAERGGQ